MSCFELIGKVLRQLLSPNLTLTQTLTLTRGQFSSGAIVQTAICTYHGEREVWFCRFRNYIKYELCYLHVSDVVTFFAVGIDQCICFYWFISQYHKVVVLKQVIIFLLEQSGIVPTLYMFSKSQGWTPFSEFLKSFFAERKNETSYSHLIKKLLEISDFSDFRRKRLPALFRKKKITKKNIPTKINIKTKTKILNKFR